MTDLNNRQAVLSYLVEMAEEMKKMAQNASAPTLALLFEMAHDEGRVFLREAAARTNAARKREAETVRSAVSPALSAAAGKAEPKMRQTARIGAVRAAEGRGRASVRQARHHAAMMADKAPGKLKLHQTEI